MSSSYGKYGPWQQDIFSVRTLFLKERSREGHLYTLRNEKVAAFAVPFRKLASGPCLAPVPLDFTISLGCSIWPQHEPRQSQQTFGVLEDTQLISRAAFGM